MNIHRANSESELAKHGYFPGGYVVNCVDCPEDISEFRFASKRSIRCKQHALAAHLKGTDHGNR